MALSTRLTMKQGMSLAMTPQLLQAIKLLQLSVIELSAYVEAELERNPLLERVEDDTMFAEKPAAVQDASREGDWAEETIEIDPVRLEDNLGAGIDNAFKEGEEIVRPNADMQRMDGLGLSSAAWNGTPFSDDGETPNVENYLIQTTTLADHLLEQLARATHDPVLHAIARLLIDHIDSNGYLNAELAELAARLNVGLPQVEASLALVQSFDPAGVAARDLAECLELQLRDRNHFDPAMQNLIAHLPLLAKCELASLRRLCGVDEADLTDMIAEIRSLDPKPGRRFDAIPTQSVVADVFVRAAADGSWHVELNCDVLPRLLIDQRYAAQIGKTRLKDSDKSFLNQCLQSANWLTKSLDQRARTILKVASEIVRQQDGFLSHGVSHLRPLNLKMIADAIGMHESTVSRVTSNKYLSTPRGLFEFKYFFTAAIASANGGQAHSAEAVRNRIKHLIEQEKPQAILSDEEIVAALRGQKIDIARRTVAKYRESMNIPPSSARKRAKAMRHTS